MEFEIDLETSIIDKAYDKGWLDCLYHFRDIIPNNFDRLMSKNHNYPDIKELKKNVTVHENNCNN